MSRSTQLGIKLVFFGLVVATVVAFFVAQRLKRTLPVVREVEAVPKYFSPARAGEVKIFFRLRKPDNVTAAIVDTEDEEVRHLVSDRFLLRGRHKLVWNGKDAAGGTVADGTYFLRVGLRREGRTATNPTKIYVDTTPPRPVVASVAPNVLRLTGGRRLNSDRRRVRVRIHGPTRTAPQLFAYRMVDGVGRLVARFRGSPHSPVAYWNGLSRGRAVPTGTYVIAIRVRDIAGNVGSGPWRLPPRAGKLRGHPQLVVRRVRSRSKGSK